MASDGKGNAKFRAEDIEVVTELRRENALAQSHRAEAFGQFNVPPAEFFLRFQKSHVEDRVVRDEHRSAREFQKLRQHRHDRRGICHICIANIVDPPRLKGDRALRIHDCAECVFGRLSVFHSHPGNFDDPMPLPRIKTRCLDIENSDGRKRHEKGLGLGEDPIVRYGSPMAKKLSATDVLRTLRKMYKPPKTFLHFRTPLDLLVATVLSAQCTDARVNLVTKTILYPKYNTPEDYVRVSRSELEKDIRTCGFFRTKAKYIQGICCLLVEEHGGKVPDTMEELTKLPGVGRKTAAIVLRVCFGKNEGIPVDTHVMRLSKRLGLSRSITQHTIECDLMWSLPRKDWGLFTKLLVSHGRTVCTAKNRQCGRCVFKKKCPSSVVTRRQDLASR